jgi:large subunit ribosomal protein L29
MKDDAKKIQGLDAAALTEQLKTGAEQMFRIRFQLSMGQAEGIKKYRILRKDRARIMTEQQKRTASNADAPGVKTNTVAAVKKTAKAPVKAAAKKAPAVKNAPAAKKTATKKPAVKKSTK